MFESHIPEKMIQERSGHRSLDALRTYERCSVEQHEAVSKVLGSTKKVEFQEVHVQENSSERSVSEQHSLNSSPQVPDVFKSFGGFTLRTAP